MSASGTASGELAPHASAPGRSRPRRRVHWYEERLAGLGEGFLHSVDACLARIQRHPEAYPEVQPRVRRAPLRRFPYDVFYVIREDRIDVLAVYHARRRPRAFQP